MTSSWNSSIKTWKKRNSILLKSGAMSDCLLLVNDGTIVTKIPVHKYILGGCSEVFYDLFYKNNLQNLKEIAINYVSVKSLTKFLEYLYTETIEFNMEIIGDLLKLSQRYEIKNLKEICGVFLISNLNQETAFSSLEKYCEFDLPNFESACLKIVRQNQLIFDDPSFYEMSNRTLTVILKSDELKGFKEIKIYEAVLNWAKKYCERNDQLPNSENKRLALGPALQFIRFCAMTVSEFTTCCEDNTILNQKEIIEIYQNLGTNGLLNCKYSGESRGIILKTLKFSERPVFAKNLYLTGYDLFHFTVSHSIHFQGIEIYGRKEVKVQNPEKFIIKLKDENQRVLCENIIEINHNGSDKLYELLFNDPYVLEAHKKYIISIQREKPGSFLNYSLRINQIIRKEMNGIVFNIIKIKNTLCPSLCFNLIN